MKLERTRRALTKKELQQAEKQENKPTNLNKNTSAIEKDL